MQKIKVALHKLGLVCLKKADQISETVHHDQSNNYVLCDGTVEDYGCDGSNCVWVDTAGGRHCITRTESNSNTVGLIIRSTPGQTADLMQWQDSSGTVLAKITADGVLHCKGVNTTDCCEM